MELQEMTNQLEAELEIEALLTAIEQSVQEVLPGLSISQLFQSLLNGSLDWNLSVFIQQLVQVLRSDLTAHFSLLGQLVLLAIVFALLRQMETGFSGGTIQQVSGLMVQSIAVLLLLRSGNEVLLYGQQAVLRMAELMQLLLPVQLLLMAGLGNVQTAGLLQPSLLLIVQGAVHCFEMILLPLGTIEFVLKMVNSFSDTYQLKGLAAFVRKLMLTAIAFTTMLFLAVLSIQGISGHVLDRLSLRTIKYMAGTAIPVVGGTLSGLMDTLMSGALMIRGAVGFVGLLVVLVLTLVPGVKLLLLYFLYTFVAAILQPVGDNRITYVLEQTANTYMLLFAIVALTGVFFFFMILIVLAASGAVLG